MHPESSESRQFVASPGFAGIGPKFSVKRSSIQVYGFVAVLALPTLVVGVLGFGNPRLGETAGRMVSTVFPVVLVLFMVGWFVWYWLRNSRRFTVSVAGSALTISKRPGDVYRFSDARLGRWGMHDATMGTVLHLRSGQNRFVLGGRDHRIGHGTRLDEPPIVGVDAWLTAQEFDELLGMMGNSGLDVHPVNPGAPVRCLLFPNAMQAQQMGSFAFGERRRLWKAASHASLAIDVDAEGIRVTDLGTNAQITSAANGQWSATPATYQYGGRRSWMFSPEQAMAQNLSETPEVEVNLAGMPPLRFGCRDVAGVSSLRGRFSWRGDVPQRVDDPAEFTVSAADWQVLVEKFGLATYLETHG